MLEIDAIDLISIFTPTYQKNGQKSTRDGWLSPSLQTVREIMSRLPLAFFSAAAFYLLVGTIWGAMMGAAEDFTLAPAHAHLNLLGWASMAIMGAFYALVDRTSRIIGWTNFVLSNIGVVVMTAGLMQFLAGNHAALPLVAIGAAAVILGAITFLVAVAMTWRFASAT